MPQAANPTTIAPAADALESLLPARMLQPGEIILLQRKPSPLYILLVPAGFILLVLALAIAGLYLDQNANDGQLSPTITASALLLLFLRIGWQALEWLSRVYVLTDRRIIRVAGVLRVHAFESPLQHIQNTSLVLSLRERLFALGTLTFATSGTGYTEAAWLYLAKPLEVHAKVIETLNRYKH